ncbi:MAG: hypothetical protein ABIJ61_09535 [bacterium]
MRVLLLLVLLPACLFAGAPQAALDNGTIRFYVANNGSFAHNPADALAGGAGLFYPADYSIDLMGGAGIWVAGKVDGDWHVSIAGGGSEFVPGPAYTYDSLAAEFPVFHISRLTDQDLTDDYRQWPSQLGAPTDAFGRPLLPGAEAAFTIFADTDSLAHRFAISNSPPLGIEGRLFSYVFDNVCQVRDTLLAQVAILEYRITNISEKPIDSCILTLYADPDIGYSNDDLICSDSLDRGMFAYQSGGYDIFFGYNPPVAGLTMLSGDLSSTNFYHSRSAYDTLPQTVSLMLGDDLEGNLYTDPTTGATTHYPYGGYPESDSGWLLSEGNDYRLMLNLRPQYLAPGETISLKAAVIVARGSSVAESIIGWRQAAALLQELESDPPRPELASTIFPAFNIWSSPLRSHDWGGRYLGGGLDLAARYFGFPEFISTAMAFRLSFGTEHSQAACRFILDDTGWRCVERVELPLSHTDLSHDFSFELGWLDEDKDGTWTGGSGLLEPLLLYEKRLSGSSANEFQVQDATLVLHLAETPATVDGVEMILSPISFSSEFTAVTDSLIFGPVGFGNTAENTLQISNRTAFSQQVTVVAEDAEGLSIHPSSFELGAGESGLVFLQYYATQSAGLNARLIINSLGYTLISDTLGVSSWTIAPAYAGDLNRSGEIDLSDIVLLVRSLYADSNTPPALENCDSDCDTDFDLVDLVRFINHFFYGAELTCR